MRKVPSSDAPLWPRLTAELVAALAEKPRDTASIYAWARRQGYKTKAMADNLLIWARTRRHIMFRDGVYVPWSDPPPSRTEWDVIGLNVPYTTRPASGPITFPLAATHIFAEGATRRPQAPASQSDTAGHHPAPPQGVVAGPSPVDAVVTFRADGPVLAALDKLIAATHEATSVSQRSARGTVIRRALLEAAARLDGVELAMPQLQPVGEPQRCAKPDCPPTWVCHKCRRPCCMHKCSFVKADKTAICLRCHRRRRRSKR